MQANVPGSLHGRTILVTRPAAQADALSGMIAGLGGEAGGFLQKVAAGWAGHGLSLVCVR